MRLINVNTLQITEFVTRIPPYAILSHRWVGREITYQEYVVGRKRHGPGYEKVKAFCKFIRSNEFRKHQRLDPGGQPIDWAWIDTCE